jgi:exonuclease III
MEEREISPPLLRRKLLSEPESASTPITTTPAGASKNAVVTKEMKHRFEILSWNVNGISHLLPKKQKPTTAFFSASSSSRQTPERDTNDEAEESGTSFSPLRTFLKRHGFPQIVCLQEVKISAKDERSRMAVERAANEGGEEGPGYKAWWQLPRDMFNAKGWGGKVYDVCTLVRSDLLEEGGWARVETRGVEWDLEGRVLVSEVEVDKAEKKEKLVIINGYWPNGTMNQWCDSSTGIVKGTRHDMKRNFHALMLKEVLQYQEKGWQVVLIGDMNIARSALDGYPCIRLGAEHVRNRREWNEMFIESEEGMRGIDSWRWMHGEKRGYSYHGEKAKEWGCSCDRVDLGVVSRGLVGDGEGTETAIRLVGADIWESAGERGGSDHVPISVILDLGDAGKEPSCGEKVV